ncbi:cytidine deaminase [Natronoarchaeum philippinense]|uniref:cytidine deaminase n=1 Tax=Natronoarchaeum philippinense TaxID=558529 RepID=A0A285N4S6_NATPI|nr:cytidine deaminase [Natronoarchaeum philippinense]SNZ04439.1 cytidine deaminase [Natronoarchaeum philippinense]
MDDLIEAAREARTASYAPYSEYLVGAALRAADGTVFTGCNIENANFSNSLHAEEVALAEAIREGHREFDAIAVSTSEQDGQTPCGMCRQSLTEFCDDDLRVCCDEGDAVAEYTLGELLPDTISRDDLD